MAAFGRLDDALRIGMRGACMGACHAQTEPAQMNLTDACFGLLAPPGVRWWQLGGVRGLAYAFQSAHGASYGLMSIAKLISGVLEVA